MASMQFSKNKLSPQYLQFPLVNFQMDGIPASKWTNFMDVLVKYKKHQKLECQVLFIL